jgi:large repetitive protein
MSEEGGNMAAETRKTVFLSVVMRVGTVLMLLAGLLASVPLQPAWADNIFFDTYENDIGSSVPSFTTGTTTTGLRYECSNCLFSWDFYSIQTQPSSGSAASITITSQDGLSFLFSRLVVVSNDFPVTITGEGAQPFVINIAAGTPTPTIFSPSEGDREVDRVIIARVGTDSGSFIFDDVRVILNLIPSVSMSSVAANPTNVSPIAVTVQFSESVTGFTSDDIVAGNGTVGNFVAVDAATYTFELTPSGQGAITADIAAGVAQDGAGKNNTAATQFSRTFDSIAPTVSMSSVTANPTNVSPIAVTVQFSESVTGFTSGDISTVNGTVGNFVAVDGDTYTLNLTPSGQGAVTANIAAGVAQDGAANGNTAATQFSRTYDNIAPTVSMSSVAANPTNVSPIAVTVQFSENVTGFTSGDVSTVNGTVGNFVAVDGDTYTFDLIPSGQGAVTANIAAGVAQDGAANGNTAATQFSRTYDNIAPTVTINQAVGQADPTRVSPVNFTVVFSEAVNGFIDTDLSLDGTGGATTAVVSGGPTTYNVAVSGMTTSGTVIASLDAGKVVDNAGNNNLASTSTDHTVIFDATALTTTSISASQNASPVGDNWTFTVSVTSGVGTPAGTVTLKDGTIALGTSALSGGTVIFTAVPLSGGSHTITAEYNGNSTYTGSISDALVLTAKYYTMVPVIFK